MAPETDSAGALTHRPIMVEEVLRYLQPKAGEVAVDCTLGGGGHARTILERLQPGGRLLGLDLDSVALPRTQAALNAAGFGPETFTARHMSFARLPEALAEEGLAEANLILADLGVTSAQLEDPSRGFSYKGVGPLDMRMNSEHGERAADLLARLSVEALAQLLDENADEPHALLIAMLLKEKPLTTTHAAERQVRQGLNRAFPSLTKAQVKMSLRRTFQALRIAVNDELSALDRLLKSLPRCLAPCGRVVVISFHSGEDRRVKRAFQAGRRAGVYSEVATRVVRASKAETFANRRVASAKLRWAIKARRWG